MLIHQLLLYNCALGDTYETITMYGAMHTFRESIKPKKTICIPLDRFQIINKVIVKNRC